MAVDAQRLTQAASSAAVDAFRVRLWPPAALLAALQLLMESCSSSSLLVAFFWPQHSSPAHSDGFQVPLPHLQAARSVNRDDSLVSNKSWFAAHRRSSWFCA